MPTYGPRRLILINAATFSYAEVDLTQPLHLVGPNNIGKTTLVNVLQVLYIDRASHMVFPGYRWAETKRHYFPGRRSYVLFECHTPTGRQVVGRTAKALPSDTAPSDSLAPALSSGKSSWSSGGRARCRGRPTR